MTLEEEFNLTNLGADQDMDLLPGLHQLRIGDEIVGDGVVLHGDHDKADFTDSGESEEGDYSAEVSEGEDYAAEFTEDEG